LIATATAAAEAERARKEGRRRKGSPRQALEHAARLAWRHLTGAPHPTITNKEDAAPTGPFIAFTSAVLREASSRLDQLPAAVERRYAPEAAAAELAAIATKPHAIADWAGKKREMGE
jgi:hypothetical protein